jgi:Transmembrane protein 43
MDLDNSNNTSDSFTETTHENWFTRLGKSIGGMIGGGILVLASAGGLWWNEGHAVTQAKGLAEAGRVMVMAVPEKIDPAHEGKLVHLGGFAEAKTAAQDPEFGITAPGMIKIIRDAEMYQWEEEKKSTTREKLGGGKETVTTYSYAKAWNDVVSKSSRFNKPSGHENPEPHLKPLSTVSQDVQLGQYRVTSALLDSWSDTQDLPLPEAAALPAKYAGAKAEADGWLVLSATPEAPQVGDMRVRFKGIPAGEVSVLAGLTKNSLGLFST